MGRHWSEQERALLRRLYPDTKTSRIARRLKRKALSVYNQAHLLGLKKSAAFLSSEASGRLQGSRGVGINTRFKKGHVPANKGSRRPGWHVGRMRETQFKKGQPNARWKDDYPVGALRVNCDGYIDMKVKEGLRAWRQLHYILWEDAHRPVPKGHCLRFKDRDPLNVELGNLELIRRRDNMLRNSIHNLPKPLADAIQTLGQLKRRIREKQDRGSAQSPL